MGRDRHGEGSCWGDDFEPQVFDWDFTEKSKHTEVWVGTQDLRLRWNALETATDSYSRVSRGPGPAGRARGPRQKLDNRIIESDLCIRDIHAGCTLTRLGDGLGVGRLIGTFIARAVGAEDILLPDEVGGEDGGEDGRWKEVLELTLEAIGWYVWHAELEDAGTVDGGEDV